MSHIGSKPSQSRRSADDQSRSFAPSALNVWFWRKPPFAPVKADDWRRPPNFSHSNCADAPRKAVAISALSKRAPSLVALDGRNALLRMCCFCLVGCSAAGGEHLVDLAKPTGDEGPKFLECSVSALSLTAAAGQVVGDL